MNLLEKAILIAVKAHAGQIDKGGQAYILHPLAVMSRVSSTDAKIVAVLHDVIEDTPITMEILQKEGFPVHIREAILAVTRQEKETYEAFIERTAQNSLAVEVKLADLEENMNLDRLPQVTSKDKERLAKYREAYNRLKSSI
ncbi:GTP pyrophosphokinase [Shimazuella sp. AN120528]|uniref:GTP pyrophosphokinase n=1 Tax=Shimazuella soli TaxID=1892854 RepID=UPI001F117D24|nr:GTP pyrophosphokinase [Shimazuella soli]MCH5584512.1 GTP pyrophosphokinase [Shimazuella soli]